MRKFLLAAAAVAVLTTPVFGAAPCREKGKFVKCATVKKVTTTRCKDAKGKFAKCGTAGAKPA